MHAFYMAIPFITQTLFILRWVGLNIINKKNYIWSIEIYAEVRGIGKEGPHGAQALIQIMAIF